MIGLVTPCLLARIAGGHLIEWGFRRTVCTDLLFPVLPLAHAVLLTISGGSNISGGPILGEQVTPTLWAAPAGRAPKPEPGSSRPHTVPRLVWRVERKRRDLAHFLDEELVILYWAD